MNARPFSAQAPLAPARCSPTGWPSGADAPGLRAPAPGRRRSPSLPDRSEIAGGSAPGRIRRPEVVPAQPAGDHPEAQARAVGAVDRPYPINLATALRLSDARPLVVAAAQAGVWVAEAELTRAKVLWVPTLNIWASTTSATTAAGPTSTRAS